MTGDREARATLGDLLRHHRERGGRSREELAARTDPAISPDTIANVERGRTRPYRQTLLTLCVALGLDEHEQIGVLEAWRSLHVHASPQRGDVPSSGWGNDIVRPGGAAIEQRNATEPLRLHNLPSELSSFVGRQQELAELVAELPRTRLLTLAGPGGVGKTRLAQRLAAAVLGSHPDGLWFVELASLADPTLVPQAVAAALNVAEQVGLSIVQTVISALRDRRLLLVLDNCEHLAHACAELVDALLRGCPGVDILATSREPLRVAGENVWRVPPLMLPPVDAVLPPESVAACDAVQLFLQRAQAAQSGFRLEGRSLSTIVEICRSLDGIPLAIEFAAARVQTLGLEHLASRLDDRLRLLRTGTRTAHFRHMTLRAALDWSYNLLDETHKHVFERLSVFASGWELGAAEVVCSDSSGRGDLVDWLGQLVDQSLVQADAQPDGTMRYRLLETVRQYGAELRMSRGDSATNRRHAIFYLHLAEESDTEARRDCGEEVWGDQLHRELDNFRVALAWCLEESEIEIGLQLANALSSFWMIGGHFTEGREWLTRLRQASDGAAPSRIKALCTSGEFAVIQSDLFAAHELFMEAMTLTQISGDTGGRARSLTGLGTLAAHRGNALSGRALHAEALRLARVVGDPDRIATNLLRIGHLALLDGDLDQARPLLHECLRLRQEHGPPMELANALRALGSLAFEEQNYVRARSLHQEALALRRRLRSRWLESHSLLDLGRVAVELGDYDTARTYCAQSLVASQRFGMQEGVAFGLRLAGALAAAVGPPARAVRLFGAAAARFEAIRLRPQWGSERWAERWLGRAREQVDTDTFDASWAGGWAMSVDEAVAIALGADAVRAGAAIADKSPGAGPTPDVDD